MIHISNLRTCVFRDDGRPLRCMHMSIILDDVNVHLPPKYSCIAVCMYKVSRSWIGHKSSWIRVKARRDQRVQVV